MIYSLTGRILYQQDQKIIIEHHGIGFELLVPQSKGLQIDQSITLYTYLHWNQEQGPSLFGFHSLLEKDLFLMMISCSGIGPKLGLGILDASNPESVIQMICQEDAKALSSIKGVGLKKAEQLIVQLKDKVQKIALQNPGVQSNTLVTAWIDLHQTLNSLNYTPFEIKAATSTLKQEFTNQSVPFDVLLRKALTILAKK